MGKLTISMVIFNSYVTNYQRVFVTNRDHILIYPFLIRYAEHTGSLAKGGDDERCGTPMASLGDLEMVG